MAHPYQKYRERNPGKARVKQILKADGGPVEKDQSRYGDDRQAGFKTPNQEEFFIQRDAPRTKKTIELDTSMSSTRRKKG